MSEQKVGCVPDGYMPIPTAEQLADALESVRCFHDMSAELIAPELLVNLLGAPTVKAEQVLVTHDLRAKLISGLDEIGALSRNLRQGGCDSSDLPGLEEGLAHAIGMAHKLISLLEAPSLPAAGLADLTAVRCQCCAAEYPHDSYDAGFIAGSGMCQACDAAMPPKDLPAAGSAVEEVEVVAWMWRDLNGDMQFNYMHPEGQELMTVAQHERIVAALSAQQSAHVSVLRETLENARRAMFAVLNQEPRMKAVAKRVLNAEIDLIDRALLNGGEA
jgi:hypothetical protein